MHETLNLICIDELEVIKSVYSAISVSAMSATNKQKHIKLVIVDQYKLIHINVKDVIAFAVIQMKYYYN